MVEYLADTHKQVDIDIFAFENIVYVRPVAIELSREPVYGTFLFPEFRFDLLSYVHHIREMKERGLPTLIPTFRLSQCPS